MTADSDPNEQRRRRLQDLYDRGTRLLVAGDDEAALTCLKDILEVDYAFRDVAEIVEDSYMEPEAWLARHQARHRT